MQKWASISCGELQHPAASEGPFGPKGDFAGHTDGRTDKWFKGVSYADTFYPNIVYMSFSLRKTQNFSVILHSHIFLLNNKLIRVIF